MFNPLFASSFEGAEIIFFVPVLILAGIIGFLFAWFRIREMAVFCAIVCALIGLLAGTCAVVMHDIRAKVLDASCAVIGLALAAAFYYCKRKEKSS
jgi:hypothetical protein